MGGAPLGPRFDPRDVEPRWQAAWAAERLATPAPRGTRPVFSLVLPPPNVTGILTIGHMLGGTVMDALVRRHRMRGADVLWVPGIDHAGLATQVEVRRRLAREGIRLEELPREALLAHVEEWKREHEARIVEQLKGAGFALDWSRYRYTKDAAAARATVEAFVRLFDAGLVYRGERMVNWDPALRTALSDLEVEHREEAAELLYLEYPWADGSPGGVTVATARPETIFGDVAIAVHPDDERHRAHVGRRVRVPLTDREVPVITDAAIDPAFGNGALKVTPRHDPVDFAIYGRHPGLELPPDLFDDSAHLVGPRVPERFRGLDRDRGRAAVAEALDADHAVLRRARYTHSVGRSERSGAVIEPRLSRQWFVRVRSLADPVVAAAEARTIRIWPDRWTRSFFRWMEGLEDWCISRQVAWGHPIPVYYCDAGGHTVAAREPPAACPACGAAPMRPDPDVLDTWFTSWLWPFAALGWPEPTDELRRFYPTSVLVTGRDIMFFWVARMLMAGYRFTDAAPFTDVFLTGMLRDDTGRRMSKHLGNSPDPLDLIRERGADALRFALLFPNPVDQDGPFGSATLDGARNFLTKLWNVVRLATQLLPPGLDPPGPPGTDPTRSLADRWILARWRATIATVDEAYERYEFTRAATALYTFVWHDLADRYLEIAKESLKGSRGAPAARAARATLLYIVERVLRALHPMVPHVTEELWHALPHAGELVAEAPWPAADEAPADADAEAEMAIVLDAVRAIRNLRSEHGVPAGDRPAAFARAATEAAAARLRDETPSVVTLAHLGSFTLLSGDASPEGRLARGVLPASEVFLALPAEAGAESESLGRERSRLEELLAKTRNRLGDPTFRDRAPPDVVRAAEEKARELAERIGRIDRHLAATPAGEPSS